MTQVKTYLLCLCAIVALGSSQAFAQAQDNDTGGRPLTATLSGDAVVPESGDPDGTGIAELTLNQGQGEICFELNLEAVEISAAHIHEGEADENGGVIVPLVSDGSLSGCAEADKDVIKAIRQNPEAYYVQVHNAEYPAGAVRGQLSQQSSTP